jgi:hypothetical protein
MSNEFMAFQIKVRDKSLLKFSAPDGKSLQTKENYANSFTVSNIVSISSLAFQFQRGNGEYEEKTIAVSRPPGMGSQ